MRHIKEQIEKYRKRCSRMGKRSQEVQRNNRLEHAVNLRPVESFLVLEVFTSNPNNGVVHHIEIRHEIDNGNDRYNVYLDGERWRNNWSRTRFATWIFRQIDSIRLEN